MFRRLFSRLCLPATVSELCVIFLGKFCIIETKSKKKSNKNFYGHLEVVGFLALSNAEPHADDTQKEFIYFMNPSAKVISLFSLKTKNNVVDMVTLFLILLFNFFYSFSCFHSFLLLLFFVLFFSEALQQQQAADFLSTLVEWKFFNLGKQFSPRN